MLPLFCTPFSYSSKKRENEPNKRINFIFNTPTARDTTYLKNRGHEIHDIQFYKNGDFFTVLIDEDLLLWDRSFNHLETFEGTGTIVPFSDDFLTAPGINGLTVYKSKTK
ncbi:hypothetical protein [Dawidia soli]|uniref:Uncharacterized protein n=1 Tax=Dawidia soli TaxID=2782352 RepID=A0AAP2GHM4_9BACT|nr:hypothetical protein [Dawidia soli]MBT1686153.1 hypothetical protein [Dawidia soli]